MITFSDALSDDEVDKMIEFYHEFQERKFYKMDELTDEVFERFKDKDNDIIDFIEYDIGGIDCLLRGEKITADVKISGKNRCIYIQPDAMNPASLLKLDYANKPFGVATNVDTHLVSVDGFSMMFGDKTPDGQPSPYRFNKTSLLLKYSDAMFGKGAEAPTTRVIENVEPFYIDNRIRLNYNIDLKQVQAEYRAANSPLSLTLSDIKYCRFNEYGDVKAGGTGDLICYVSSAEEILENIKANAEYWLKEHEGRTYAEALVWASDCSAFSAKASSAVAIKDYRIDDMKFDLDFWIRDDLFECKHIFCSPNDLSIYAFRDSSRTEGMQFDFNDYRQYYMFGEYLLITKSAYQKVRKYIESQIAAEDTIGKIKCPVCGAYNEEGANICRVCFFDELSPLFLNRDDAKIWEKEVVAPYKEKYRQKMF